ncbi:hypothetical protein NHX12_034159 [Muraenolepis orangiensis]|uniref:Uncharacterized protein n=1 Tax=Muraenolepis orangiensis TaxID=630683 RepID=A0A9Q0I4E2_9TELE|nr:hypothetical protein NHX12_034159 [Muraenolepis orangiensis]
MKRKLDHGPEVRSFSSGKKPYKGTEYQSPLGSVLCPATPTTFGHIRTANCQGQQRQRITSIQPPTGLQEWLRTFQSWSGPEKLLVLDELIDSCEPTQVKHMMQLIEPQFQRDFISLLPKESSTPLDGRSERLARKRRGLGTDSLESLYFTPMAKAQTNSSHPSVDTKRRVDNTSNKSMADSTMNHVKRRRNTRKNPGHGLPGDRINVFYSLTSARSQPNLSNSPAARPVSVELFGTPADKAASESVRLLSLPGYRLSTTDSMAPSRSTVCVGAENESDNAPYWMRIAELQARNKTCLPHLKSSYPVESRSPEFIITEDNMRTGDTICRASVRPDQLQDSLSSHRLSHMVGPTSTVGAAPSSPPAGCTQLSSSPRRSKCTASSRPQYPLSPEVCVVYPGHVAHS